MGEERGVLFHSRKFSSNASCRHPLKLLGLHINDIIDAFLAAFQSAIILEFSFLGTGFDLVLFPCHYWLSKSRESMQTSAVTSLADFQLDLKAAT